MPMSEEARKAQSERMKARHAENKKVNSKENGKAPEPGAVVEYTATDGPPVVKKIPTILVEVDWERIPMGDGQQAYAKLRIEFEKAGRILNARSMKTDESKFICFMCKGEFNGMPAFRDDSYKDEKTGLLVPVRICGQRCVEMYNLRNFEKRRDANQRNEAHA